MAGTEKNEPGQGTKTPQSQPLVVGSSSPPPYDNKKPPAYSSVASKIQDVRAQSKDKKDVVRKLGVMVFCNNVSMGFMIVLCILLPIVYIAIGAVYVHDCPRERMIPIYLIVGGCFAIVRAFLNISEVVKKSRSQESEQEYKRSTLFTCCDFPVSAFLFSWFVAGNVWIFRIHKKFQSVDPTIDSYCHASLYGFAFWSTIFLWILILLPIFLCGCVACIACLGLCKAVTVVREAIDEKDEDEKDEGTKEEKETKVDIGDDKEAEKA